MWASLGCSLVRRIWPINTVRLGVARVDSSRAASFMCASAAFSRSSSVMYVSDLSASFFTNMYLSPSFFRCGGGGGATYG